MLRIVRLTILPGMLLTACTALVYADTVKPSSPAATTGKSMYSSRPAGYTVQPQYYGTPMPPRFIAPGSVPYRVTVVQPRGEAVAPVPVAPVLNFAPSVPAGSVPTVVTSVSSPPAPQTGDKTTFILREPQPQVSVNDELDAFNARLAKIQLEKHQLVAALTLVQKIKSKTFKVKTVINLAEYVSRDKNYRSEAEQLYRLAIAGIEALDQDKSFQIDLTGIKDAATKAVTQPEPSKPEPIAPPQAEPPKPAPPAPVVEQPKPEPVTPTVPDKPKPIPLDEPKPDISPPPDPPKPPIQLDNDTGKSDRMPPESPPRETVTSPPENPVSPEEAPPALTQERPVSPPRTRPKPTILLDDDSPPDSSTPAPATPSGESPKPVVVPAPEAAEPEPPPKKPVKRPLPKIILDEN